MVTSTHSQSNNTLIQIYFKSQKNFVGHYIPGRLSEICEQSIMHQILFILLTISSRRKKFSTSVHLRQSLVSPNKPDADLSHFSEDSRIKEVYAQADEVMINRTTT